MRTVFADAGYWIALLNPRDRLHERAKRVSRLLGRHRIVTSELILIEYLDDSSCRGEFMRRLAVGTVERLRKDGNTTIVPLSRAQFAAALGMYADRPDKTWSLTDCSSFQIMERYGLREALAHDEHFEQAGFKALLREAT
jgi:predicted nucleic acid-binding protein